MHKAIFLDRDDTINRDTNYLIKFEDFQILDGVIPALRIMQDAGFLLFITTNQSGIARGFFSIDQVDNLNCQIHEFLKKNGITITETVYCPHLENGKVPEFATSCDCRKPRPGMILHLQKKYNLDLKRCFSVGDKLRDVQAGEAAGVKSFLIKSNPESNGIDVPSASQFDSLLDFATSLK
ncbi:D-glycero-alpha-D-manno-heptose-1,7-bisphosphate 7-phosphatase [Fibrobacterota bacterium]